jgi:hypothetical protein
MGGGPAPYHHKSIISRRRSHALRRQSHLSGASWRLQAGLVAFALAKPGTTRMARRRPPARPDRRRRPHCPSRPGLPYPPPARRLAPRARVAEPLRSRLRPARHSGLTSPDPVRTPNARQGNPPPAPSQGPGQPAEPSAAGKHTPKPLWRRATGTKSAGGLRLSASPPAVNDHRSRHGLE